MEEAVLTTGASRGIGLDVARHLAGRGYLSLGTVRSTADAERLSGHGAVPVEMDVTDRESIDRAVRTVTDLLAGRPLRALVNNAGVPAAGPLELLDVEAARAVFDVNVFGALAVTRAFLPLLRQSRGRIVNISSVSGRFAAPFAGVYAASKFALEAASDALRRELAGSGIRVILVEPGSVRTGIWDEIESMDMRPFRGTPYESIMPAIQRTAVRGGRRGMPAARVSRAVFRAISARRPPARIPVVSSRASWYLWRRLPTGVVDRMIARGLRRAASP